MNRKSTVVRGFLASGLATIGLVAGMAAPSVAAPAVYTCQNGEVCGFQGFDAKGSAFAIRNNQSVEDLSKIFFTNGVNADNKVESIVNKRQNMAVFAFPDANETPEDEYEFVGPGETVNLAGEFAAISSIQLSHCLFFPPSASSIQLHPTPLC